MFSFSFIFFLIFFKIVYGDIIEMRPGGETVELQVFYESECAFSRMFVSDVLQPLVTSLGPYIHLQLHPFGNAKVKYQNGDYTLECQHGPVECHQNKVHACALKYLGTFDGLHLITCLIKSQDDLTYCGKSLAININEIGQCAQQCEGDVLHLQHGIDTALVHKKYVPYILINGQVFDVFKGVQYFKPEVCAAFKQPPPGC